ncbi:MAG: hypothetical protein JST06_01640 [Bacteroidetes bacterium]|nr:hypothetical protein [Bacteroidota bacterium]MBS1630627.1 hypothetical protein [Bacteroidota bacterium]
MKKYLLHTLFLLAALGAHLSALACPACEKQQPKILRGITHGAGPQSNWDYVIVWVAVIIVIATLFFSVKWLIRPGEQSNLHIKRWVLDHES